jgi:sigma-E factor negative regulatory protein RseB
VVTCYMPDSKAATVGRQQISGNLLSQLAENDFSRLQDYYQFSFEAVERVAGQSAQRILIKPKDASRYGYRLWVDEANAILLRFDLLDEQGEGLEQTMFADISIGGDIPDALLVPESHDDNFTWFKHEQAEQDQKIVESRWTIARLPQGFSITTQLNHQMPNSDGPTEHWVLSDGLASISIYIEQIADGQPAFEGASAMGATNAFGVLKKGESNDFHQITVIGEVPADTVEKLARAITLKTPLAD